MFNIDLNTARTHPLAPKIITIPAEKIYRSAANAYNLTKELKAPVTTSCNKHHNINIKNKATVKPTCITFQQESCIDNNIHTRLMYATSIANLPALKRLYAPVPGNG